MKKIVVFFLLFLSMSFSIFAQHSPNPQSLPLYFWSFDDKRENFGDYISWKLVERITESPVRIGQKCPAKKEKRLLAIGSIFQFALDKDVIWGSGIHGRHLNPKDYRFTRLDVRAVRGPLSRQFLIDHFQIQCPEIYGDPALLFPLFFPEFKRKAKPRYPYIVIPHYSEEKMFPKKDRDYIVYPTDPWDEIIEKILDSEFVIASSLHGIIVAEAFGIPARMLRVTDNEPLFKYKDYYSGTGRPNFCYALSVEEALQMGSEPPFECNLKKLLEAFPTDFWPSVDLIKPIALFENSMNHEGK